MEAREETELGVLLRGGTSFVKCRPEFSSDSTCLMCCSGHVIKVLSIKSGECIHTLKGHTETITGIKLNPRNRYQLLSSSKDGNIIKWDYKDGILIKRNTVGYPIAALYTSQDEDGGAVYAVVQNKNHLYDFVVLSMSKKQEQSEKLEFKVRLNNVSPHEYHNSVSSKCGFLASISGSQINVYNQRSGKTRIHRLVASAKHESVSNKELICVRCHPTEFCVATADNTGKIILWYDIFKSKAVHTFNHWHKLSIGDLAYTPEGSYLLSGGQETVLVKWHSQSHDKEFLPHLGAGIVGITVSHDNTCYAICHSSNGIQVISSVKKLLQSFQGFNRSCGYNDWPMMAGLNLDPRTKALVANGIFGHLQFYDMWKDKQLFSLDVVQQNYIAARKLEIYTNIECVAFDKTGDWLATVDRWHGSPMQPQINLKFWNYITKKQSYSLNTLVQLPHKEKVSEIKFRPIPDVADNDSRPMLVSTGTDGVFKLWSLVDDTDIYRKNERWDCESQGYYRQKNPSGVDFADDGSLLAVGFEQTLTLWDPDTNALRTTFSLNLDRSSIKKILFGQGTSCHLLAVTTNEWLYVWNILTCAVSWCLNLKIAEIVVSPVSDIFAVFTDQQHLHVHKFNSPDPLYTHEEKPVSRTAVKAAVFIPSKHEEQPELLSWQQDAQLFFLNEDKELLTLGKKESFEDSHKETVLRQDLPQTPFSILLTDKRKRELKDKGLNVVGDSSHLSQSKFLDEMLSTPAHVMPPVSSLALTFMEMLMLSSKNKNRSDADSDDSDDDDNYAKMNSLHLNERNSEESDMETETSHTPLGDTSQTEVKQSTNSREVKYKKGYHKLKSKTFKWL